MAAGKVIKEYPVLNLAVPGHVWKWEKNVGKKKNTKKNLHQKNVSQCEGKKFDDGKLRVDLLPSESLFEVAKVLGFGAVKYGEHNWRKGMEWSRLYAAAQRHMMKWNAGETHDEESGVNHLAHACVNLLFLLHYENKHKNLDDRYFSDTDK